MDVQPRAAGKTAAIYASRGSSHYDLILTLMCVVIVISNIGATKGVQFALPGGWEIVTDGGFFLFPLAYILGDVVSEVYGFKAARRAIFAGFTMALLAVVSFAVIIALPGFNDAYGMEKQAALEAALGPVWQIVLASLLGFLAGQMLNSLVLVRMKERFREKALAGRLMVSTGVGEFADTLIFCAIAAPVIGITDAGGFFNYVLFGFLYKTLIEYLFVPVTAMVIRAIKKREPTYAPAGLEPVAAGH